jgi:hypothetical protein
MKNRPLISIVIALNEIKDFHGGSLNGIKSEIDYFTQFLMLYESINENWCEADFDFNFYLVHSIPFSDKSQKILDKIDVAQVLTDYSLHKTKIRPVCYSLQIECDFRLVLDVDMLALGVPKFDLTKDFLAMYGGNKYNWFQWKRICSFLDCKMPVQRVRFFGKGKYNYWSFKEHHCYQLGLSTVKKFPYFNNGAVLISNKISHDFSIRWDDFRISYTTYVKREFNIDCDMEGQDVVGLAINDITENWGIFNTGINFILQDKFVEGKVMVNQYEQQPSLIHYINASIDNPYFQLIKDYQTKVILKYYDLND